jgi:hypothetical protein
MRRTSLPPARAAATLAPLEAPMNRSKSLAFKPSTASSSAARTAI